MTIDEQNGRAYVLFRMTGNVGLMKREPNDSFQQLLASTTITGSIEGSRTSVQAAIEQNSVNLLGVGDAGQVDVTGETVLNDRVYVLTRFASSFAMDQSAKLLATHFSGAPPLLRIYSTSELGQATDRIASDRGLEFYDTPLDSLEPSNPPGVVSIDQNLGIIVARDLEFGPQLSVLSPRGGTVQRGELAVHVAVRDEEITRIECNLTLETDPLGFSLDSGTTRDFTTVERKLGIALTQEPDCLFDFLPRGDYMLTVTGYKGAATDAPKVVVEIPFRQDAPQLP
jgi:hypothetical protein